MVTYLLAFLRVNFLNLVLVHLSLLNYVTKDLLLIETIPIRLEHICNMKEN